MPEPIPVLHLITELDAGGAQSALARLMARLDRQRFNPAVACLYNGDALMARRIRALGVPVTDLGMVARWRWDAFGRLYRLLRHVRPAILHTWMFHANLPGRVLGRLAGVPIIITSRRNENIGGAMHERLNRWTAHLDDRVVAVCELARQAEIERARVPPEHVVTVYNGVDTDEFSVASVQAAARARRAMGLSSEALLVGSLGRLHPQKGYSDLLAAFAQVRQRVPSVQLLLAGGGEMKADLEAQARSLGLAETVTFAGVRADVPDILAALDVFVLPSLWEGMPNAVLEAMASGLPVVATAVGGTPEVVVDGVTGLLVPPQDPGALARAIERLLRDPGLRRTMGRAGWRRIERHFDIRETVRQVQDLYEMLLREKGRFLDSAALRY